MATIAETLERLTELLAVSVRDGAADKVIADAERYIALFTGKALPCTDDEHEAFGRRPLPPDETDLYHASHRSLPSCPHCGHHAIVIGEINVRTSIVIYRIECVSCHASVFCSSRQTAKWPVVDGLVRQTARDGAIDHWSRRVKPEWQDTVERILGVLFKATEERDDEAMVRAYLSLQPFAKREASHWDVAACWLCKGEVASIPVDAMEGAVVICKDCFGKHDMTNIREIG